MYGLSFYNYMATLKDMEVNIKSNLNIYYQKYTLTQKDLKDLQFTSSQFFTNFSRKIQILSNTLYNIDI